jgi:flagellar basal body-associated protein FliL
MVGLILILILLIALIGLAANVFWIWMLIDSATNKKLNNNTRLVWLLVIIFTHILGAIIYFFAGRSPKYPQMQYQNQAPYQPQRPYQPYIPAQQPYQHPYQSYQHGYQPQQQPPPPYQYGNPYMPSMPLPSAEAQSQYEQPQTQYPEQPQ